MLSVYVPQRPIVLLVNLLAYRCVRLSHMQHRSEDSQTQTRRG